MADSGKRGGRPSRVERADRQVNAGHSRALDVALAKTESKIRNMKTERVYAYDKNGKEIAHSNSGTNNRTALPEGNYKDSIVTHNHPNKGIGNTIAGRVGTVLSGADIYMAIASNVSEIRNVTKTYTYSLKRPKNGWGISKSQAYDEFGKKSSNWKKTLRGKQNEYLAKSGVRDKLFSEAFSLSKRRQDIIANPSESKIKRYNKDVQANQRRGTEITDRYNVGVQYSVMKEYAKKYGWSLTRKRTV